MVLVLFQRPPARTRRASCPGNGLSSNHHVDASTTTPTRGITFRSALGITPTSQFVMPGHLVRFALRAAFPPSLAGRDSCDYYQTSVAIGLASRRRSHVRPCCTYRAELRRPTHLLKCPHWASPASRRLRQPMCDADTGRGTGSHRVSQGCSTSACVTAPRTPAGQIAAMAVNAARKILGPLAIPGLRR